MGSYTRALLVSQDDTLSVTPWSVWNVGSAPEHYVLTGECFRRGSGPAALSSSPHSPRRQPSPAPSPNSKFLVLCPLLFAPCCSLLFALCPLPFALCPLPFALCPLPFALCPLPLALGSWLLALGSWLLALGSWLLATIYLSLGSKKDVQVTKEALKVVGNEN
jgi:hypothetical protein